MLIEVTDKLRNSKTYEDTTRKFGITINGIDYLVKFPKRDDLSVYCEYVASAFIAKLGVPCQRVHLGTYNGIVVDVIEDFITDPTMCLHSFNDTNQSSLDTDITNKEYTYADVLYVIDKHLKLPPEMKYRTIVQFWQMFVCDAILGNRDRHGGNWGYVSYGKEYMPAPLFDNGASLFPGVNKVISQMYTDKRQFLYDRIYIFPASLFKVEKADRTYKTNYGEILRATQFNEMLTRQLNGLRKRYSVEYVFKSIYEIVQTLPNTVPTDIRLFWIEIVTLRYLCLIHQVDFDKALDLVERRIDHVP